MEPEQAKKALEVLRARTGRRTDVVLSSGRTIAVWDVAWGRDNSDDFDRVTTNISPRPTEPHESDFIFTSEISAMVDPTTGEAVFEGPPGLRALSSNEQLAVKECFAYILGSGALAGEFETRIGVTERTVEELLDRWPEVDHCGDLSPQIAINNALNEVLHGLHISEADWSRWFTRARVDIGDVYERWARAKGLRSIGAM